MSDIGPGSQGQKKKDKQRRKREREKKRKLENAKRRSGKTASGKRAVRSTRSSLERPTTPSEHTGGKEKGSGKERSDGKEPGKKESVRRHRTDHRSVVDGRPRSERRRERAEFRKRAEAMADAHRGLGVEVAPDYVDRKVEQMVREAREARIARAEARQRDQRLANAERELRPQIGDMPNGQLLKEANRVHREFQSDDAGPLHKTEMARTLERMRDELQDRIDNAPRDAKGTPQLDGVDWGKDNPRAGHVDGLAPFDQSHVWERHLGQGARERPPRTGERRVPRDQRPPEVHRVSNDRYRVGGYGTGSAELGRGAVEQFKAALPEHVRKRLDLETTTIVIKGRASMVGSNRRNDKLSRDRAERFREELRASGVKARIVVQACGSREAEAAGKPESDNSPEDRRIDVEVRAGATIHRFDRGDVVEVRRTTIPREYTYGYKNSRSTVQSRWWKAYQFAKTVIPTPTSPSDLIKEGAKKGPLEAWMQSSDAIRYRNELKRAPDVHAKLWGIPPPRGFLFDSNVPSVRYRVESWLSAGGYDVKKMWPEYVIHWMRKGIV